MLQMIILDCADLKIFPIFQEIVVIPCLEYSNLLQSVFNIHHRLLVILFCTFFCLDLFSRRMKRLWRLFSFYFIIPRLKEGKSNIIGVGTGGMGGGRA